MNCTKNRKCETWTELNSGWNKLEWKIQGSTREQYTVDRNIYQAAIFTPEFPQLHQLRLTWLESARCLTKSIINYYFRDWVHVYHTWQADIITFVPLQCHVEYYAICVACCWSFSFALSSFALSTALLMFSVPSFSVIVIPSMQPITQRQFLPILIHLTLTFVFGKV